MKPEDIPQWAWEEADDTTYNIETDGHGSIEYTEARVSIALLVMKARSQALEEAIKIVDGYGDAMAMAGEKGEMLPIAPFISQAIRNGGK